MYLYILTKLLNIADRCDLVFRFVRFGKSKRKKFTAACCKVFRAAGGLRCHPVDNSASCTLQQQCVVFVDSVTVSGAENSVFGFADGFCHFLRVPLIITLLPLNILNILLYH